MIAGRRSFTEAAPKAWLTDLESNPRQGGPAGNAATIPDDPLVVGNATRGSFAESETERHLDRSEIHAELEDVLAADPELEVAIEALLNEADADERAVLIESLGDLYPVVVE